MAKYVNIWVLGGWGLGTGIALPDTLPVYPPGTTRPPYPGYTLPVPRGHGLAVPAPALSINRLWGSNPSLNSLYVPKSQGSEGLPRVIT